jgi:uncharacterized membrane protein YqjE
MPSIDADGVRTYGPEAEPTTGELPVGELTTRLVDQVARLVRQELELARVEATRRVKRMGLGASMFGGAGLLAFFGMACLIAAAVLGLSNVTRPWLAALVVGAACFLVAALVALPGKKGFTSRHPAGPQDTVESLKADAAAVREAVRHG